MKRYIKSNSDFEYSFDVIGWESQSDETANLMESFDSFREARQYASKLRHYYRCDIYKQPDNVRICQYRYGKEIPNGKSFV